MNKLIQSAGSTVLDAVPVASSLVPFVEHVLPLAFGTHPVLRINEIMHCNNTEKNNIYSMTVTSYNDQHRLPSATTRILKLVINERRSEERAGHVFLVQKVTVM